MPENFTLTGETIPSEEYFAPQDGVTIDPLTVPASLFLAYGD